MCGIAGIKLPEPGPVGEYLVEMMAALVHRGADSTGFALYGPPDEARLVVRVRFADGARLDDQLARIEARLAGIGAGLASAPTFDGGRGFRDRFGRLEVAHDGDIWVLVGAIEGEGIDIQSVGHSLEIVKDVGTARDLAARHDIRSFEGTHGLGFVRLATESRVTVKHSHPFWARPYPDIAIVHNGQLTNYWKFRRLLEQEGYRFSTDNDSELISVYIADHMARGTSLYDALRTSVVELDGCFTYLISTPDGIGTAKDPLAVKPLVVVEAEGVVAIASEEQALRHVFPEEIDTYQPGPKAVIVWERKKAILQEE